MPVQPHNHAQSSHIINTHKKINYKFVRDVLPVVSTITKLIQEFTKQAATTTNAVLNETR